MPFLTLDNLCLHYGEQVIFDDLQFQLDKGDRVCIIGRNGVGKSTLLKIIEQVTQADSGSRWVDPALTIASLSQELPQTSEVSVYEFVASGLGNLMAVLKEYDELAQQADADLDRLSRLQHQIEAADGWSVDSRINQVLSRLKLDGTAKMNSLSGGWRRRVSLAQALVRQPDILLLDEPTNHLDIAAIEWLEQQLKSFQGAIVFITHDRAFLRSVANKIGELDRGRMIKWDGDYDGFLNFKEQKLAAEERENELFDKKLAQEEIWIRQGIKARRTRNEGRVRALKSMRDERSLRREKLKTAKIEHSSDVASGKLVAELKDVSHRFTDKPLINQYTSTIIRGDKIGLVGPNGIGKTTLLKIILGQLEPQEGTVKRGTKLEVAYFDQTRDQLDGEKSAIDNISEGRDYIEVNGKEKHIISYLQDFLFSGERARTPIKTLSGGERNRILLAKMFSKTSNLLIMDEPTNDLDAETLELLEELLASYDGTLLLVSHDREFLDNVVTSTIAFEGRGVLREYVGGYQDWIRQGGKWPSDETQDLKASSASKPDPAVVAVPDAAAAKPAKKLSYKLQQELSKLPAELEKLETELESLQGEVASPDFYQQDQAAVNSKLETLSEKEQFLQSRYERWEELESM